MGENDVEGRGKTALSWRMMITTGYSINKKIEIKTNWKFEEEKNTQII